MSGEVRSRSCVNCKKVPPNGQSFGWCSRHAKAITLCPHCLNMGYCGCGQGRAVDGSETPTEVMPVPGVVVKLSKPPSPDTITVPADLIGLASGHFPDGKPWVGLHVMTEHGPRMIQFSYRHAMTAAKEMRFMAGELQAQDKVN